MSNIKKLNGYDIIDSKMYKTTATINSLALDEAGQTGTNIVDITLPEGWSPENTFITGGYIKVINDDSTILVRHINSNLTDTTTGDITFSNEVGYYNVESTVLYAAVENYIEAWVGYEVEFTVLLYNKA